jgi:hypothetical protein
MAAFWDVVTRLANRGVKSSGSGTDGKNSSFGTNVNEI